MKRSFLSVFLFFALFSACLSAQAQRTTVTGKVTDAGSGDPVPFASVYFKDSGTGTTTDFDGNFSLTTDQPGDSLTTAFVGYRPRTKAIKKGVTQSINFQLEENIVTLEEIIVRPGENPAIALMRQVIKNKEANDKRKLSAFEYDTYTRIEVDVDNMTEKFRQRKIVQKITAVLDSIEQLAGEDGQPILPIMISESVSKVFYRDNPALKKERILKTKITGLGVEDGTTVTQMIGSSFQEYNFYQNWLNIVTKDFISPLADGWRLYYEMDLMDSTMVNGQFCYRLDFYPRSKQDLAFTGSMWITKDGYALKQIDATVNRFANLNFIEKIRIQQELDKVDGNSWLPVKNRILIDVGELTKSSAGMLAKFYTSNRNFILGKPYPPKFYERTIETAEDFRQYEDDRYWDTLRHQPLTKEEQNVYKMVDTLRNIPVVRTYTDIVKTVVDGYYKAGPLKLGPYLSAASWNNIEGLRLTAGFKTTLAFSKKWIYTGQIGYGLVDERFKYLLSAQRILDKKNWTTLSIRARRDVARIGVDDEALADNPLFLAALRWGIFRRGYYSDEYRISMQRELFKGFSQRVSWKYWTFDPTYPFAYFEKPGAGNIYSTFQSAEISMEARYAKDELFIQDDNERISLGANKWPVFWVKYTHGFKGVGGSDFSYDKLRMTITKRIRTGPLGTGYLTMSGEYVFNTIPYPMLALHLGNQSPVYSSITYNLMDYGEFISDRYASMQYRQYLEGFLLNRLPLLKKLNWRLLGTANVITGGMRESNRQLISSFTSNGVPTPEVGFFGARPYVELGYGVENIFRFLRVDFVHRMTYLKDRPDARRFGILFTAQFQL
ncbi:MAG: DUF5686 family protein [Cyclobacteriaceae bacterium]